MNRERLYSIGMALAVCWFGIGMFGGIVYTNRNWNAENVEMWPRDPDFVLGEAGRATSVYVDQGPVWLARFLFEPPWWAGPVLYAGAAIVVIVAIYKIAKKGVEPDALEEMIHRAVTLVTIAAVVTGLKATGHFPYAVDVVAGLLIGLAVGWVSRNHMDWMSLIEDARAAS